MFFRKKNRIFLLAAIVLLFAGCQTAALLLCGCGNMESKIESNIRASEKEVSSEWKSMHRGESALWNGLCVDEGDLKESGVRYTDAPMEFHDPVIEEMLRNMIGKPEGEVYISELQEIHAIYGGGSNYFSNLQSPDASFPYNALGELATWEIEQSPESLKDLSYCYNLQWITFDPKLLVTSFEPLYDLPQLETIDFLGITVTEEVLNETAKIKNLKRVNFGNMEIPFLRPLQQLPQLETLEFVQVSVTEQTLQDIGTFSSLKHLCIGHGEATKWGHLTDGSFLLPIAEQLTILLARGDIDWNPEVLSKCKNLEILALENRKDISFLEQMPNLKKMSMHCCTPDDWSPLGTLEHLEYLDLSGNGYTTVEITLDDLKPLKNLKYVDLGYTTIEKENSREEIIEALPSLTGLKTGM